MNLEGVEGRRSELGSEPKTKKSQVLNKKCLGNTARSEKAGPKQRGKDGVKRVERRERGPDPLPYMRRQHGVIGFLTSGSAYEYTEAILWTHLSELNCTNGIKFYGRRDGCWLRS